MADFRYLLAIYVHAHQTGNSVPPHIDAEARAALAEADGPAVSDDREPASVMDQLKHQLLLKAKSDLIREVINQALKDTASVHWRVTDTGEQLVRVGDLLRWAEQAANNMEKIID